MRERLERGGPRLHTYLLWCYLLRDLVAGFSLPMNDIRLTSSLARASDMWAVGGEVIVCA
jgi:hypothetical protein